MNVREFRSLKKLNMSNYPRYLQEAVCASKGHPKLHRAARHVVLEIKLNRPDTPP